MNDTEQVVALLEAILDKLGQMQAPQPKLTLTVSELAKELNTSDTNAYQMIRRQDFPAFKDGGKWMIPRRSVERWLEEQAEEKAPCTYPAKSTVQRA